MKKFAKSKKALYLCINKNGKTMTISIQQMEQALREINFFVGGLTDKAIEYYYNKLFNEAKN